jgi:chorismate synthase
MRRNTACATIAAAAARRRARPRPASRPAPSREKILPDVKVRGALVQMGPHKIDRDKWDWDEIARNPFFCPDKDKAAFFESYLDGIRKSGSSIGAGDRSRRRRRAGGLGCADLCQARRRSGGAMMSINAVKGVEIGAGFGAAELSGEENADEMRTGNNGTRFLSNHAGGVLGGISTGQPVVVRFAVKPTSSILSPRQTVDRAGADTDIMTKGRHDPCVGIRAVPVGEAMMACVLADHFLRHRGQVGTQRCGRFNDQRFSLDARELARQWRS